jgi:predicted NACHT family NTPase
MLKATYDWKRFWCPRERGFSLADGGYLYDPDSEYGRYANPDVVSFEAIADTPCLVLLGEPGIGKSHAMQADSAAIDSTVCAEGGKTLWLDLRRYSSEDGLVRDLFRSEAFQSWATGAYRLHLFLDSLDECLLRVNTVAAILSDELRKYPVERLRLRIACRTADWPVSLEHELRGRWGDAFIGVYELVPLRRADVAEAARTEGVDAQTLLAEIDRAGAVPLAIKPVTLDFLLRTYLSKGRLPSTQAELYEEGCRILCEEANESRRDACPTPSLSGRQRMAVAARIAAVTTFGNRYAVWNGADLGAIADECIAIADLSGSSESFAGQPVEVTEAAVEEALSTGLFSSRGTYRMGWAHQTYAEFLAAWYLLQHNMPLGQIMSLIVHAGDREGKLVPQLHETAAWLAGMSPGIFRQIMQREPEVLLRSDVASTDERDRVELVGTLLSAYDEGRLFDTEFVGRDRYRRLDHPGLVDQLRPYICDRAKDVHVRGIAIDIAHACNARALQEDLLVIALDASEPLRVRVDAARAVVHIGDEGTKARLRPLALGEVGEDPEDELKGVALYGLWPTHITAADLFAVLIRPKRRVFLGAYQGLISRDILPHLKPFDLPIALAWVETQMAAPTVMWSLERLADEVLLYGWQHLDSADVLQAFARAALSRLMHRHEIISDHELASHFSELVRADDSRRRCLAHALLPKFTNPREDCTRLLYCRPPLIHEGDPAWMIQQLNQNRCRAVEPAWARLIVHTLHFWHVDQMEMAFFASRDHPALAEELRDILEPVELDSDLARRNRTNYERIRQLEEEHRKRPLVQPPPAERIAILLDRCKAGNTRAWCQLNMDMTLEPHSVYYDNVFESDLTALPGWKAADDATRARIVEAAKQYVLEGDPANAEWLGKNILHDESFSGYRALRLLLRECPESLSTLPAGVWRKWAAIILAYPGQGEKESDNDRHELVNGAYRYAPDEVISSLVVMIDKENHEGDDLSVLRSIGTCWDDRLADALLDKAKDPALKPDCLGDILDVVIAHGLAAARRLAESLVQSATSADADARARAVTAARVLMTRADDAGWPVVWPTIQQDTAFGRLVFEGLVHGPRTADMAGYEVTRLAEDQLADLYVWLARQYPHAEDPRHEGVHAVGPREAIARYRDSVLGHLKQRGTPEACIAIARITSKLPGEEWLKRVLQEAQAIARHHTWIPPTPADILRMAVQQESHLVQSGAQLLEVLIESLTRLEAKLQGEKCAATDLWNTNVWTPKQEDEISNYIARYLEDDLGRQGIVINREVRIHRSERTDIHVDAVSLLPSGEVLDTITAIIEVKPCWNRGLGAAMETQLVGKYLKGNRCQHGLYLVPWFVCARWSPKDYRLARVPTLSLAQAQAQFDTRAAELSQRGVRIRALVIDASLKDKSNPSPSPGEQGR